MMTFYTRACIRSLCLVFVLTSFESYSQNILTEIDHDARRIYDRMIILSNGGPPQMLHTSIYPYWRTDVVLLANFLEDQNVSKIDAHQLQNIWDQNNEFTFPSGNDSGYITFADSTKTFYYTSDSTVTSHYRKSKRPLWNTFYRTPAFLYEVDVKDFYLRINPIIHFAVGKETQEDVTTFINQRGLSLRGGIGKNVYFSTSIYDSQIRYPNYVNQFTQEFGVVPGAGLYK